MPKSPITIFHEAMTPHRGQYTGTIFVHGDWHNEAAEMAVLEGLIPDTDEAAEAFIREITPTVEESWHWRRGMTDGMAERGNEIIADMLSEIIFQRKKEADNGNA